jgi:tetratricopeptide (TPR) repeat protein
MEENRSMNFIKMHRISVFIFLILLVFACTPKKPEFSPQQLAEFNLQTTEADNLYSQGSYLSLKKAMSIYESQIKFPAFQSTTKTKLLKTALLLSLRENELIIVENRHLAKAIDLIESYPELSDFSPLAALVLYTSSGGSFQLWGNSAGKYDLADSLDWINKNVVDMNANLKERAESEAFYAYYYLTLNDKFRYNLTEEKNFDRYQETFKDSPLIQYKLSIFPKPDRGRLEALIEKNPHFYESYIHLGNIALSEGKALTAEKKLLFALEHFPSSMTILKNLAQIYYLLEEFEESLEYNDKILFYLPGYRDALLGKAICLSYLGRQEEAVAILNGLVELGMYLMGESHYWLAWNLNEMGQLDLAMENVNRAQTYLIGHSEVHLLAGIIAFERGDVDGSEDYFKQALWINQGECEALFYMGKIDSIRKDWGLSGIHFESAAICYRGLENALNEKIKEIEKSSLSPARKDKHIARKKMQLRKVQVTKATAFYNAAAGYFNAGIPDKAKSLAQLAREHKSFQAQADELISKIKDTTALIGNKK